MQKKVSEWIIEHLDSHGIFNAAAKQASFEIETGKINKLPSHTMGDTRKAIANDPRGGVTRKETDDSELVVYGYYVAYYLAQHYGTDENRRYRNMMGRGFMFRAAIESIKQAGN